MHSNWTIFKSLCRIIGGRDYDALSLAVEDGLLPQLVEMAGHQDLLPALALRFDERPEMKRALGQPKSLVLQQALQDNTRRNMQTVMHALKLARALNGAGITPTFLKGTAQLLTFNESRLGFRKQVDIDLVVSPDELRDTCRILLAAGYSFYRESNSTKGQPDLFHSIEIALKQSNAHHHLPPMVIDGYTNCVEVHRHFLPRRFQRKNPLEDLLGRAKKHESRGAGFRVPSAEHQIIHIVEGKMIRDGYLPRRSFPIREGCDYIDLLESKAREISLDLVEQHCGKQYRIFSSLVQELMLYRNGDNTGRSTDIRRYLYLMEKRYNSALMAKLLDTHARALHLGSEILHNPAKLPEYLQRLGRS